MKLCRFGQPGQEKPGVVDDAGTIRDLSGVVDDITVETIAKLQGVDIASLPVVGGSPRYGVPVKGIGKIVAIGLNYRDHAIESNLPIPTEPMMFMKALSSLSGPNDVSERFNQKQRGTQWSKGKGHDTFCPVGPWLVTPDEVGDAQDLDMHLDVNGTRMQTGNTRTMIFDLKQLIAYVSEYVTLQPGDLLITGTPPGVGEGKKPDAIYLKAGDVMELGIAKLGTQRQQVVAWRHLGEGVLA